MNLEVSIIVPDRIFYREQVREVILPTLTGQMGVLKGHIPILTGLDIGVLLLRLKNSDSWIPFVVTGGFALVSNNSITILVNEAELGSSIDFEEAEQNLRVAQLALLNSVDKKKEMELLSLYKRAYARVFRLILHLSCYYLSICY
uniref:ATP synthase epsilon chain, chloroplastic n=1 Tax=Trachelomonas grandis TaxID=215769 RepID=A0A385ULQ8_9EUGL|nr:ATPase epsilon subunit [Trachelomonas grandis]